MSAEGLRPFRLSLPCWASSDRRQAHQLSQTLLETGDRLRGLQGMQKSLGQAPIVEEIAVPVSPSLEQAEIFIRVAGRMDSCKHVEELSAVGEEALETLEYTLLARAFRGGFASPARANGDKSPNAEVQGTDTIEDK